MRLTDPKEIETTIKELLAEHIGVEPDDIKTDDFFIEDLHMSPTDLSDFVESLGSANIDISHLDLTSIETVEDLLEVLTNQLEYE